MRAGAADPQRLAGSARRRHRDGATTTVAPRFFDELGFDVHLLSATPAAQHQPRLRLDAPEAWLARWSNTLPAGRAFDGDGDRAILIDAKGQVVDGDAVLLMCGRHLQALGQLKGNAVVATVMSNIGLELAFRASGIEMVRCPVGDKYVMEEMIKRGLSLGGEQSGHIIFSDHLFTGDGIVTALSVLRVMADTGRELADLASELVTFPHVLLNVRVREKRDLQTGRRSPMRCSRWRIVWPAMAACWCATRAPSRSCG